MGVVDKCNQFNMYFPVHATMDILQNVLNNYGKFKIKDVDRMQNIIYASKGMNLLTYGENITIQVFPLSDRTSSVSVESKPKMPTTLIDYGKNKENLREIMRGVGQYLIDYTQSQNLDIETLNIINNDIQFFMNPQF